MKKQRRIVGLTLAAAIAMLSGCTNYVITHGLEQPLVPSQSVFIGEMRDGLPADTDPGDKPTLEAIDNLRTCLANEITRRDLFGGAELYDSSVAKYELIGAILNYKKGSGFLRFLFGMVGNAEVTVQLELRDIGNDAVLFSGNFKGIVNDWAESGDKMFQKVSKDFVKAVEKQNKAVLKTNAAQNADLSK